MTLPGDGPEQAQRLLAEADADPGLRDELARAYDGRHDVLDALWWRAHPGTQTPGGRNDPDDVLSSLARRAFRRQATPADVNALREAERVAAADASALEAAIAGVVSGNRTAPTTEGGERGGSDASGARAPVEALHSDEAGDDAREGDRRGGHRLPTIVAVAAVAVLAATSGYLAFRLGESEDRFAPGVPAGGLDPIARFAVEQTAADELTAPLPRDYDPASVRRLVRDEPGLLTDYALFGARTDDREVCLLLVFPDEEIASSCVSVPEFRRNGIEVSTNVLRPSAVSEGATVPVAHTVTWQPDDSLLFASSRAETP